MYESSRLHPAVARALAAARPRTPDPATLRPLGAAAVDRVLGGGLMTGACHELFAREERGRAATASVLGFAVMLAQRLMPGEGTLLWLREERVQQRAALSGPGLIDLGLDPARLVLGILPDARALLRASVDALRGAAPRHGGLGVVILELEGNPALLDLTASRRLSLAAEQSGATLLLARPSRARPAPSAARTRWDVGPAPSGLLAAGAPGRPALSVTLLRQRGGASGHRFELEWDRDAGLFRPAALPGARLPLSGGGPVPATAGEQDHGRWRLAG